jgi:hypothetical protein
MAKQVLSWEKPKQVMSKEEWAESYGADGAPPGCFQPNMSPADIGKWKAKLVGQKTGFPQVEIRKDSTVIILSLTGYKYKWYDTRRSEENLEKSRKYHRNASWDDWPLVHIATAGPMQLSLEELDEMKRAIDEGLQYLRDLKEKG